MRDSTASAPHGVRLETEDNTATNNKIAPVYEKKNESAENIPGKLETGSSEQDEAKEEVRKRLSILREKEKKCATCEARTHDLQIMRLTRCRLRQGGS